jgi:excisionase family DNA binding protein
MHGRKSDAARWCASGITPNRDTPDRDSWCVGTHTPTPDATVLLTSADAARIAQVSRETIYREIDRGELRARHVGRQLRIDPADFRAYLERAGA